MNLPLHMHDMAPDLSDTAIYNATCHVAKPDGPVAYRYVYYTSPTPVSLPADDGLHLNPSAYDVLAYYSNASAITSGIPTCGVYKGSVHFRSGSYNVFVSDDGNTVMLADMYDGTDRFVIDVAWFQAQYDAHGIIHPRLAYAAVALATDGEYPNYGDTPIKVPDPVRTGFQGTVTPADNDSKRLSYVYITSNLKVDMGKNTSGISKGEQHALNSLVLAAGI